MNKTILYIGIALIAFSPILSGLYAQIYTLLFGYMNAFHGVVLCCTYMTILILGIICVFLSLKI